MRNLQTESGIHALLVYLNPIMRRKGMPSFSQSHRINRGNGSGLLQLSPALGLDFKIHYLCGQLNCVFQIRTGKCSRRDDFMIHCLCGHVDCVFSWM